MSKNESRREALADKYPEVEEHFQEIMKEVHEPQIERLGETNKEQKERTQYQGSPS